MTIQRNRSFQPSRSGIEVIQSLRIGMLPSSSEFFSWNNQIAVGDNFSVDHPLLVGSDQPFGSDPVALGFALVIFCRSGEVTLNVNDVPRTLTDNMLTIIVDGSIIDNMTFSPGCRALVAGLDADYAAQKMELKNSAELFRWLLSNPDCPGFELDEKEAENLQGLIVACRNVIMNEKNPTLKNEVYVGFMYILLSRIISWSREGRAQKIDSKISPRDQRTISRFSADLQQFGRQERGVTFYAQRQRLSPKYFSRVITTNLGKRPTQVIQEHVVLEAKCLLRSGKYTIREVCEALSFPNQSFFSKYFRKVAGCTPGEYMRRNYREEA